MATKRPTAPFLHAANGSPRSARINSSASLHTGSPHGGKAREKRVVREQLKPHRLHGAGPCPEARGAGVRRAEV